MRTRMNTLKTLKKDEKGMLAVEASVSFVLYVLLFISILSLVNITALQSRIHYALTQAALAASMYSYVFESTGLAETLMNADTAGAAGRAQARGMVNDISRGLAAIENLDPRGFLEAGGDVLDRGANWLNDPKATFQMFLSFGLSEARGFAEAEVILRPLMGRYLTNGSMDADNYLKSVRVIGGLNGIKFSDGILTEEKYRTAVIDGNDGIGGGGNIKIFVTYEVDYSFGILSRDLPFSTLKINQSVVTKAWLGGRGMRYE